MLENRDEYIFPDHHGLLIDGGDRIRFLKIDEVHNELLEQLENQKQIDMLVNDFVVWGNELLLKHMGPSYPIQLKRTARPVEASYVNAHLNLSESVMKYQISWQTRVKPIKMVRTSQLFTELASRRYSVEERWLYWLVERQRILVMCCVNEVKEAFLLKATEYDSLLAVDDTLPFKPSWLDLE